MGKLVNKAELSSILGVSERSLTDWQEEDPPLPIRERAERRGQSNKYDTADVIDWLVQRNLRQAQVEAPRDRLARLQAEEIELRLNEKRGLLVPTSKIEPLWLGMVSSARSFLRSQIDDLAELVDSTEGLEAKRDLLRDTFDQFLQRLSDYDPGNPDPTAERGPGPAAAAAPCDEEDGAAAQDLGGRVG